MYIPRNRNSEKKKQWKSSSVADLRHRLRELELGLANLLQGVEDRERELLLKLQTVRKIDLEADVVRCVEGLVTGDEDLLDGPEGRLSVVIVINERKHRLHVLLGPT